MYLPSPSLIKLLSEVRPSNCCRRNQVQRIPTRQAGIDITTEMLWNAQIHLYVDFMETNLQNLVREDVQLNLFLA
jgi:hypothetical protein